MTAPARKGSGFYLPQIIIPDVKGERDRTIVLPDSLVAGLRSQIEVSRLVHQKNLKDGYGEASQPYALDR